MTNNQTNVVATAVLSVLTTYDRKVIFYTEHSSHQVKTKAT